MLHFVLKRSDTSKTEVIGAGVDLALAAIAWHVAFAVWISAAEKLRLVLTTWLPAQVGTASWFPG
jgi:hypothetical protein